MLKTAAVRVHFNPRSRVGSDKDLEAQQAKQDERRSQMFGNNDVPPGQNQSPGGDA